MSFNTFLANLGKYVELYALRKFAKFLGDRVLKQFYAQEGGCQYVLVCRRSMDLLCWDVGTSMNS
jgi:hypothetical protein